MADKQRSSMSAGRRWSIWIVATAVWVGGVAVVAALWRPGEPGEKTAEPDSDTAEPGPPVARPQIEEPAHFVTARRAMVEHQLAGRDISDPRVLDVLGRVPRHRFVPERLQDLAYADTALPIGLGQTISQPYIVALMTQLARPTPECRVLEVGTGSGYQAAVLGELCSQVYSIEIVEPLAQQAKTILGELGYQNVTIRHGDGYQGWPEYAPFDIILVTAAPDHVPQPLIDQLAVGGRMVVPVGRFYQELTLLEKQPDGELQRRAVAPVMFVPMTGEAQEKKEGVE